MSLANANHLELKVSFVAIEEENALSKDDVYARLKRSIFDFRMPPGQRYAEHELTAEMKVSRRLVGLSRNQTMLQAFEGLTERIRIIRLDFTSLSLSARPMTSIRKSRKSTSGNR